MLTREGRYRRQGLCLLSRQELGGPSRGSLLSWVPKVAGTRIVWEDEGAAGWGLAEVGRSDGPLESPAHPGIHAGVSGGRRELAPRLPSPAPTAHRSHFRSLPFTALPSLPCPPGCPRAVIITTRRGLPSPFMVVKLISPPRYLWLPMKLN